jgi:indoleamine 2,3-dioxygenase
MNWEKLTTTGFLPEKEPATRFSDDYYESWNDLLENLALYNSEGIVREKISKLPCLDIENCKDESEVNLAYLLLSMAVSSYVNCPFYKEKATEIPSNVSTPLLQTCSKLGIRPIVTHTAVDVFNFKTAEGSITLNSPEELSSILTFTGSREEEWFYLIMTKIEAMGSEIFGIAQQMEQKWNSPRELNLLLARLSEIIGNIAKMTAKTRQGCSPEFFFYKLRPYLEGWENMIYLRQDTEPLVLSLRGGSAAQSSLIPCIDAILGVNHADSYSSLIREYMTEEGREVISYFEEKFNLKTCVQNYPQLSRNYQKCLSSLRKFREHHRALARDYILKFKQNADGTGGTEISKFLTSSLEETVA